MGKRRLRCGARSIELTTISWLVFPAHRSARRWGTMLRGYLDYPVFRFSYFVKHGRARPEYELTIRRIYSEGVGTRRVKKERCYKAMRYEHGGRYALQAWCALCR